MVGTTEAKDHEVSQRRGDLHVSWMGNVLLTLVVVGRAFPKLPDAIAEMIGVEPCNWWMLPSLVLLYVWALVELIRWANRAETRDEMEVRDRLVTSVVVLSIAGICCAVIGLAATGWMQAEVALHGRGFVNH